ncbi:MAG: OmpA family protein [Bacteroidetes bacterium]|nr:OmpA family protein [Bacteroidota bacterium]
MERENHQVFPISFLLLALAAWLGHVPRAAGQLSVKLPTNDSTAIAEMVTNTLIGNGILAGHFQIKAPRGALGTFDLKTDHDLVKSGLVLSTGHITDLAGPNDTTCTSTEFMTPGDDDLGNLIGRLNADAVSIEFDFIPFADSIGFFYFFGSEEYPEFVGKGFNDAFAFMIMGPGYPYYTNIARLSVGNRIIPITIDNLNFIANKDFYIANHLPQDIGNVAYRQYRKLLVETSDPVDLELDGLTKKLRAVAMVQAGSVYRLKIVIADVGDMRFDSGVFLEKESFSSSKATVSGADSLAMYTRLAQLYRKEPAKLAFLENKHPHLKAKPDKWMDTVLLEMHFASDSHLLAFGEKRNLRRALLNKLDPNAAYRAYVSGHTDSTASTGHNDLLSKKRAAEVVAHLLKEYGVQTVVALGHGENQPKEPNGEPSGRAANRRVEIVLIKSKT